MPLQDMSTSDHKTTPGAPARAKRVIKALCGLRVGGDPTLKRIACAGEAILISDIQAKSPAGPEAWPMKRIVDNHVPPVETPLLGSLRLLPGLPNDTLEVLDNLARADRTLD